MLKPKFLFNILCAACWEGFYNSWFLDEPELLKQDAQLFIAENRPQINQNFEFSHACNVRLVLQFN